MNVTKTIPNLIGGISQQPAALRLNNQLEDQLNFVSSPAAGLQNRPALKYVSSSPYTGGGAFFTLDRDEQVRHNLWIGPDGLRIEDLRGNVKTVQYQGSALAYLSLPAGADKRNSYRILNIADSCFIINRTKTPQIDQNSITESKNRALIHIKQVALGTTWSVTLHGKSVSYGYSSDTSLSVSTEQVASELANALLGDSAINAAFNIVHASSVISIERKDGGSFSIGLSDSRGNTYSSLTTWKNRNFTDLPTIAPDGFTCCISGSTGSAADDYYVRFVASGAASRLTWQNAEYPVGGVKKRIYVRSSEEPLFTENRLVSCTNMHGFTTRIKNVGLQIINPTGSTPQYRYLVEFETKFPDNAGNLRFNTGTQTITGLSRGTWEECVAPDIPNKFVNATMPHLLVHDLEEDMWIFKPVNWTARLSGDAESAPWPSFIGKKITALFLYRNRLGFVAGDSVSLSAAGDLERFFPETVQTLTDADPIDLSVSVDDYSDIRAIAAVQDKLFFFSNRRQYTFSSPDAFSPKTAAILPSTAYPCLPDIGLPVVGGRLYFATVDSAKIQVREYGIDPYTDNKTANLITAHVAQLIPKGANMCLVASPTAECLAFFSSVYPNTLFLYQYYVSDGNKLQSAWSRQTFNATILNMAFRDNVLWLELLKNNQRIMCTLDLSTQQTKHKLLYEPALDFQTAHANVATVTLPYTPDTGKLVVLVKDVKNRLMRLTAPQIDGRVVNLGKEYSYVVIGETYARKAVFSEIWPTKQDASGAAATLTDGRLQLRRWTLSYFMTGPFVVRVKSKVNDHFVLYRSNQIVGRRSSVLDSLPITTDSFTVPCRGRNTEVEVSVESDNYFPHDFLSMDVEGNYTKKNKNI